MKKRIVSTSAAPAAIGPYSQGIVCGDLVFVSGQMPLDPVSGEIPASIADMTRRALQNVDAILQAAGSSLKQAVKMTVYLKDMETFAEMNAAYAEFFDDSPPCRTTVEAARLPKDVAVEIDAIAYKES